MFGNPRANSLKNVSNVKVKEKLLKNVMRVSSGRISNTNLQKSFELAAQFTPAMHTG